MLTFPSLYPCSLCRGISKKNQLNQLNWIISLPKEIIYKKTFPEYTCSSSFYHYIHYDSCIIVSENIWHKMIFSWVEKENPVSNTNSRQLTLNPIKETLYWCIWFIQCCKNGLTIPSLIPVVSKLFRNLLKISSSEASPFWYLGFCFTL